MKTNQTIPQGFIPDSESLPETGKIVAVLYVYEPIGQDGKRYGITEAVWTEMDKWFILADNVWATVAWMPLPEYRDGMTEDEIMSTVSEMSGWTDIRTGKPDSDMDIAAYYLYETENGEGCRFGVAMTEIDKESGNRNINTDDNVIRTIGWMKLPEYTGK